MKNLLTPLILKYFLFSFFLLNFILSRPLLPPPHYFYSSSSLLQFKMMGCYNEKSRNESYDDQKKNTNQHHREKSSVEIVVFYCHLITIQTATVTTKCETKVKWKREREIHNLTRRKWQLYNNEELFTNNLIHQLPFTPTPTYRRLWIESWNRLAMALLGEYFYHHLDFFTLLVLNCKFVCMSEIWKITQYWYIIKRKLSRRFTSFF